MFALEFPPINEILRWTDVVPSVNKIALIAIAAVVVASVVFLLAGEVELPGPAADAVTRCREQGVLVIQAGPNVIRMAPPLVIERDELAGGLDVVEAAIAAG